MVRSGAPDAPLEEDPGARYMRYVGQGARDLRHVPGCARSVPATARSCKRAFDAEYARLYRRVIPEAEVEVADVGAHRLHRRGGSRAAGRRRRRGRHRRRSTIWPVPDLETGEEHEVPLFWRPDLEPGAEISGTRHPSPRTRPRPSSLAGSGSASPPTATSSSNVGRTPIASAQSRKGKPHMATSESPTPCPHRLRHRRDVHGLHPGRRGGGTAAPAQVPDHAEDPSIGALEGMTDLLRAAGIALADGRPGRARNHAGHQRDHRRTGARLGLLTTRGFRDILEMGTEQRYDIHDLFLTFPRTPGRAARPGARSRSG